MAKSKYIIVDIDIPEPFVFSETMTHAEVAAKFNGEVLGAGFCFIKDGKYVCYGESVSLKISSREVVDANLLNSRLGCTEY